MTQYNIFQALYMSFYSRDLYRDVGRNWGAGTFLYLFVLVTIVWSISIGVLILPLSKFDQAPIDRVVTQIPVMEIKDGVLITPAAKPYVIESVGAKKRDQFKLIIDTTGQYKTLESSNADILITSTTAMIRTKPNEVRIYEYPKDMNETIQPVELKNTIIKALYIIAIPVIFFIILGAFCYHIIKALLYSLIGKVFNNSLSYGTILQITMVAITPALVLSLVLSLLQQGFFLEWLLYFIISMFYMFFGINANKV